MENHHKSHELKVTGESLEWWSDCDGSQNWATKNNDGNQFWDEDIPISEIKENVNYFCSTL